MSVSIRRTEDFELVHSLERQVFGEYADQPIPNSKLITTAWWVAKVNGKAAGFAGARIIPDEPSLIYFIRVGVLDKFRGKGIHRRFNRARLAYARRNNCEQAITYTLSHNCTSSNNLMRAGFKMYHPEYEWVGDGPEILYWIKSLSISD